MAVLLLITLLLALLCDWQLGKRAQGHPLAMERFLALLPYAPLLLAPLAAGFPRALPYVFLAAASAAIGLLALLVMRVPQYPMPALGYLAVSVSLVVYVYGLYASEVPAYADSSYFPLLCLYLIVLLALERTGGSRTFGMRLALCLTIAALGALGLYQWNGGPVFAVSLACLALLMLLTGFVFNARAYYYTAALLFIVALIWTVFSVISGLSGESVTAQLQPASSSFRHPPGNL